jgi:Dirigent-like protein
MKKAATLAIVALVTLGATASASGARAHKLTVKFIATNGYFIDNAPSGTSGGDLFGSSGDVRRAGAKVGRFSSACTAAPPVGGQCQATLILRHRGRFQLAGNIRTDLSRNILSVVGGTGKYRNARGTARLQKANQSGSVQRVHLRFVR